MRRIQTEIDTSDDQALVETITGLHQTTLTDDAIVCIVCNESISDGEKISCYLLSPSGATGLDITQVRCRDHRDSITELATLGVTELIVDAYIGRCRNEATGESSPVLLYPRLRYVSEASTTTARKIDAHPYDGEDLPVSPPDIDLEVDTQLRDRMPVVAEEADSRETATLSRWADTDTGGES